MERGALCKKKNFTHDGRKRTNEKRDHISYHIIDVGHAACTNLISKQFVSTLTI